MKRAVAALVLLAACSSNGSSSATTQHFAVPTSYHITYAASAGRAHWTEELWVNRPFESDDMATAHVIATFGHQIVSARRTKGVLQVPPNPAPSDVRLDAVVRYAVDHGLLERRGSSTIIGRKCQIYRSLKSLATRTMASPPTAPDHVDSCVDRSGLVLEERTTSAGKGTIAKRASRVELATQHDFTVSGTDIPLDQGGGRVTALTDDSRPPGEPFWQLDAPPAGFIHQGRYAVVPPQPRVLGTLATSVDDVFTRGADVIVVSNGHRATVIEPDGVRVGNLALYVSAAGSRVVKPLGQTAYVEVRGTVPPTTLLRYARSLSQQPAGTLVTR